MSGRRKVRPSIREIPERSINDSRNDGHVLRRLGSLHRHQRYFVEGARCVTRDSGARGQYYSHFSPIDFDAGGKCEPRFTKTHRRIVETTDLTGSVRSEWGQ